MHDRCENYIQGRISEEMLLNGDPTKTFGSKKEAKISAKYLHVLNEFKDHPNGDKYTEHKLGYSEDWSLSTIQYRGESMCIGVLDAVRCLKPTLHIGEWKSGSPKDTHGDQRKLYALFGMRKWTYVDEVKVTTYYLEDTAPPQQLIVKNTATAEEKLKALWNGRVEQMRSDKILAPKPGDHCRWCDYAKSKGGPCVFGG